MEREWLRSRVLDWMFTCALLPNMREQLRPLIKQLGPLYDTLRAARTSLRTRTSRYGCVVSVRICVSVSVDASCVCLGYAGS